MLKISKNNVYAFTLIELLIVIVILGVLAALISGNFITSLKKGRDARRKGDLEQVQKALELYYEDNKAYPIGGTIDFGAQFCYPSANGCTTRIYMERLPEDPKSQCHYDYVSTAGTDYKLYSFIENVQDQGSGVNQSGYDEGDCGESCPCRFGVTSSNTSL